uniref:Chaperone protein DnaJ n=1 Tax=Lygus hesperus TaxID=30085 RepID=A0A0A9VUY2_LYGHE
MMQKMMRSPVQCHGVGVIQNTPSPSLLVPIQISTGDVHSTDSHLEHSSGEQDVNPGSEEDVQGHKNDHLTWVNPSPRCKKGYFTEDGDIGQHQRSLKMEQPLLVKMR